MKRPLTPSRRLYEAWDAIRSSMWAIPGAMFVGAAVLAFSLLGLDQALAPHGLDAAAWLLFAGTPEGAREILSTIAGSLMTVVSVAFSVTILAFQQAATRYTPRVLQSFRRDRGIKIVLGFYIATFTYSLLVLRRIRQSVHDDGGFAPPISITGALVLSLVSVALLVWFLHHVAEKLQVAYILASIREDLDEELEHRFPKECGVGSVEPPRALDHFRRLEHAAFGEEVVIRAPKHGYLRRVVEASLEEAIPEGVRILWVRVRIGDYVRKGGELVRLWTDAPLDDAQKESLADAFTIARSRSILQDPMFGFRQIVDIAIKALSPGIFDPTTAEEALDHAGAALASLAGRELPPTARVVRGAHVLFEAPSFADFVDATFSQIRRAAKDQVHVQDRLLSVIETVAGALGSPDRAAPLQVQLQAIAEHLANDGTLDPHDRRLLEAKLAAVHQAIRASADRARSERRREARRARAHAELAIARTRASTPSVTPG